MAGDWIPMRVDIADDPAVIAIAAATGLAEDTVVGKLHRLWCWANKHLDSGYARGVTVSWIDRYIGTDGFAAAMLNAGWLRSRSAGVEFPSFERWNSQGAKKRVLTAQRMRRMRDGGGVTTSSPEKRRGEKSKDPPDPPLAGGGDAPKRNRKPLDEHRHFAAFWTAYPRKTAKPNAAKAFARIDPDDDTFADMLAAIDLQRRSPDWCKDGGQFIPHPATWLNQRRWEDQPPEPPPSPPPPLPPGSPNPLLPPNLPVDNEWGLSENAKRVLARKAKEREEAKQREQQEAERATSD